MGLILGAACPMFGVEVWLGFALFQQGAEHGLGAVLCGRLKLFQVMHSLPNRARQSVPEAHVFGEI
jgi:hypothetical protein